MENILILSQIIISISILIVWVFRYDNIVIEFEQYGLSSLLRNIVGASKISLATILVIGIWHHEYLFLHSFFTLEQRIIGESLCPPYPF